MRLDLNDDITIVVTVNGDDILNLRALLTLDTSGIIEHILESVEDMRGRISAGTESP